MFHAKADTDRDAGNHRKELVFMKNMKKMCAALLSAGLAFAAASGLTGCGSLNDGKRIVRISHAQSETQPEHLGLLKFKEYIEERLGDKYEIQIYPNELLGGAQKAIELTQTGAIDFVVAGTANLENFADVYTKCSVCRTCSPRKAPIMRL